MAAIDRLGSTQITGIASSPCFPLFPGGAGGCGAVVFGGGVFGGVFGGVVFPRVVDGRAGGARKGVGPFPAFADRVVA